MLDNISISDVYSLVTVLVGLIGGIGFLYKKLKKWLTVLFEKQMQEIKAEIKGLSDEIKKSDMENCKNFLIQCMANIDRGHLLTEAEKQRFYEEYQHYIDRGGNTYIQREVELLQKEGKL